MSDVPLDAILALVQYLEVDERKDFEERRAKGETTSNHIYNRIRIVSDWLDSEPGIIAKRERKRLAAAIHEAGHAVIGRALTLPCGEATIEPDVEEDALGYTALGYSNCGAFWSIDDEWLKRGKARGHRSDMVASIITDMAGAEAECEILGLATAGGDISDRHLIAKKMDEGHGLNEERLRRMTRMLVRRHRKSIERVANVLLAKTTLSGVCLNKLIGRSIDDVKPNMSLAERVRYIQASRHVKSAATTTTNGTVEVLLSQ